MSTKSSVVITATIHMALSEIEARALHALVGYGTSQFLNCFYDNLGQAYLKPHEKGLITLFSSIRRDMPKHFTRIDNARDASDQKPKYSKMKRRMDSEEVVGDG